MRTRIALAALVCALLLAAGSAWAQQADAPVYTFVAEWAVPRAQWGDWVSSWEKNNKPILEKMSASGDLVGWGSYSFVVHGEDGYNHGTYWVSKTVEGIEKTRDELIKVSPSSAMLASTKHRDYFLRSLVYKAKSGSSGGYLSVSASLIKPGQGQDWLENWKKFSQPVYDDLLAKGIVTSYGIDVEDVHTMNPNWRFVYYTTPSAAAEDQVSAAFQADRAKRSAEESRAIGAAFRETLVPGEHWDQFLRFVAMWSK